jgi:predicted amidohydrolase YtcJ
MEAAMPRKHSRRKFLADTGATAAIIALGGCSVLSKKATDQVSSANDADLILFNGSISTMDPARPRATAAAVRDGRFVAVGEDADILKSKGPKTRTIDVGGRRMIPGLNDSHLHIIRGGLNYNLELRWDGVPSLADAMRMLKAQVARTPAPQWVRVVGGFCEFQFQERRLPTLAELNAVAPDTPVFILHLYDRALLNGAALRAVGYTKDTPQPPGGMIERDKNGEPTGLLLAQPNAAILYKTLSLGPKLPFEYQYNSTRHFLREMNRLGLTSCSDAGGGFQNYPEDYEVIQTLQKRGELTVRIAYNLFTQNPSKEKEDFARWVGSNQYRQGDDYLRLNGAGEMLVYSAADFEDFRVPRPNMPPSMENELRDVVRLLAKNRWPFRLHATYNETIERALSVFADVHREIPLNGIRWFFDHCETVSDRSLERIRLLGGGIAVQDRMAFQGEYFVDRYGKESAERTPPIRRMLEMGIPVGAGTDATRVSSYNPWVSLWWLVTGKTLGGLSLYPETNRMSRDEALRLFTVGSAWFSGDDETKGKIAPGLLGDLTVLSEDYFKVPDDHIKQIESLLTIVGGNVVYAAGAFAGLSPPPLPVLPEWSPVAQFGGARRAGESASASTGFESAKGLTKMLACGGSPGALGWDALWGGCSCFAF